MQYRHSLIQAMPTLKRSNTMCDLKTNLQFAVLFLASLPAAHAEPPTPAPLPVQTGKAVYEQHCAACHGLIGDGHGPASVWLSPKPRNFNLGLFKIQSTPFGSLPTDDDLFQTITRGMPGRSMPSFVYLGEKERREVVQYVKYLTAVVEGGHRLNKFEQAAKSGVPATPVTVPPEPAEDRKSVG